MTDTPRTDAIATAICKSGTDWHHSATLMRNYANGLELELAQVTAYNTELYEKTDHHAIARELADWKARYKSLDGIRCNLDIKLTVARAELGAIEAGLSKEYQAGVDKRSSDLIDDFTEFLAHHQRLELEVKHLKEKQSAGDCKDSAADNEILRAELRRLLVDECVSRSDAEKIAEALRAIE